MPEKYLTLSGLPSNKSRVNSFLESVQEICFSNPLRVHLSILSRYANYLFAGGTAAPFHETLRVSEHPLL